MKYRKKPVVIEATQWTGGSSHPEVKCYSDVNGREWCGSCKQKFVIESYEKIGYELTHGWVDTLEGGHIVCPSDWIIKGIKGEYYPVKNDIFLETYEKVGGE